MAYAMIYPEPQKLKRMGSGSTETVEQFSAQRLSYARTVLRESPNRAHRVLHGTEKLDAVYQDVVASQIGEKLRNAQMLKLEKERPDLAEKVRQEEMTFDAAMSKAKSDAAERKQKCWAVTVSLIDAVTALDRDAEYALEGGRGHKKERVTETATLSATRLREARTILRYAPDLAPLVLAGAKGANGLGFMA